VRIASLPLAVRVRSLLSPSARRDETASATVIAREMLAQAEHDPDACVVAVLSSSDIAALVEAELDRQLANQPRADIIAASLRDHGAVITVNTMTEAVELCAAYAPEHLLLLGSDAESQLPRVRNAGTVFVGESSSVSFGDYLTGANHVLPTGALARSYSGLSTQDFYRWTTYQVVSADAAARLAGDAAVFAEAEGLFGHAIAARALGSPGSVREVAS
jgi:histidinol dehydrogenase